MNIVSVNGYRFDCLTSTCLCDTDDEVIHCHNARLETVPLPENRLRGFLFLGMTGNRIRNLPSEQILLNKFPDLKVIDVENNHGVFDCESLAQYNKIKVLTDCGKEDGVSSIVTGLTVPDVDEVGVSETG